MKIRLSDYLSDNEDYSTLEIFDEIVEYLVEEAREEKEKNS